LQDYRITVDNTRAILVKLYQPLIFFGIGPLDLSAVDMKACYSVIITGDKYTA